jgi:hypothetical protein
MDHRQEAAYRRCRDAYLDFMALFDWTNILAAVSDRQLQRLQFPSRQFDKTKSFRNSRGRE